MKKSLSIIFAFLVFSTLSFSQKSFLGYYQSSDLYYAPPAVFKYGLYGFNNSAVLNTLRGPDILLALTNKNFDNPYQPWGLFYGAPHNGFGFISSGDEKARVYDYRYNLAFGSDIFGIGLGYGFVGGNKAYFQRSNTFHASALWRPIPYISMGAQFTQAIDNHDKEYVAELGFRPIKNYPLTFFGDAAMFDDQTLETARWSAGISYEFLDGLRLSGRYFNNKSFNVGLDISFGEFGVGAQSHFTDQKEYGHSTFILRSGSWDRTITERTFPPIVFAKMDLSGSIKYQRNIFFDNSMTLMSILQTIEKAKENPAINGLIINMTDFSASRELLWEVREKLKEFKLAGKKIYVFTDRMGINEYHIASVADKIIIDDLGAITFEGYMLGRSFYKQLLEKSGIGFEEIRLFKYKSAVENFSREKMSDADREQRQKLVDDWMKIAREEITLSRNMTPSFFDSLVNGQIIYNTKSALDKKLVDGTGRWINSDDIIKKYEGKSIQIVPISMLSEKHEPIDDKWGDIKKNIAIVYAIGECAMDQGIKARSLVNVMKEVMEDNDINAVVLRVDSPGGDAMASDYIADVLRAFKGKKPIVVSQGMVAGSGGYWLSMDADKIVAAPMTITGSIGVISGRVYDKGLKDKLGITTDLVKSGKYVDLNQSFALPLIEIGLPVRNYNDEEKTQVETEIKSMYDDFVSKVADGRKMTTDSIGKIAQGRVWSGLDGKKLGLVDEIGGIEKAIFLAKKLANIPQKEEVNIIELPEPQLIDFSSLLSSLVSVNIGNLLKSATTTGSKDNIIDYLKFRAKNNDRPMTIMPIEYQDLVPAN